MESQTIILLIIVFVLGAAISWFLGRRGAKSQSEGAIKTLAEQQDKYKLEISDLQQRVNVLDGENKLLKKDNDNLKIESEKRVAESEKTIQETEALLKRKYDELLNQIREENSRLDNQLKLATEGKVDEVVKEKLANATLAERKVKEIEAQLADLHQKHESLLSEHAPLKEDLEKAKSECLVRDKKIKKLTDDLEEAEEEQEELQDKLKKKNKELQASQDELEETNRDKSRLKTELEEKERELSDMIDDIKKKTSSIAFVHAILSAVEEEDQDNKVAKKIDLFEAFIKGQYLDCLTYLNSAHPELLTFENKKGDEAFKEIKASILNNLKEWAAVKRKSWLNNKKTIAFVGEFSAGKTSIVNRLLSQDNPNVPLLPVSSKATTAIPTYIAGGVSTHYNFVSPDDKLKKIEEEDFKKVSKEVLDEIKGVSSLIKYFVMTYKNPNLDGLSILDTPGFNSNDKEDKDRTIGVINECDALFWVFDVNAGTVNRTSIELIKKELDKPLYVVINKVDTKAKSEVDKVESLIQKTLLDAGLKVEKYIRFSSKAPLDDIMNPIHSINSNSHSVNVIAEIKDDLENLSNFFLEGIKEWEKNERELDTKCDNITNKFVQCMQVLYSDCEEAAGIPQWTEHFFSSDRYEMTEGEGGRLINLLNKIANDNTSRLAHLYDEANDVRMETQHAFSMVVNLKADWRKINECYEEFKKLSRNL